MTEYPPVPYILASQLNRYRGRTVRVLGRVTQTTSDGSRFVLETPDGGSVTVTRSMPPGQSTNPKPAGWALVTGTVQAEDLSVLENVTDWLAGEVDAGLAKSIIGNMHKLPALFAV